MPKIIVTQPLGISPEHKVRLERLGEVTYFDERAKTLEEWLERVQGFDIICTGVFGIREKSNELHDTFVSLPFVGVGWADPEMLKEHNVTIANSPGCNRLAVAEWIIAMTLLMARNFLPYINIDNITEGVYPEATIGLTGKKMAILGKGNIGQQVGHIAEALGMQVNYFQRGDVMADLVRDADVVVDALSVKPDSNDLLNDDFFAALKNGAFFVTVSAGKILDTDAMFRALDSGKLAFAASDAQTPADTRDPIYRKLLAHPKVLVTPHVAFNSDVSNDTGNLMMIENVEAWVRGEPIHVVRA
ncbi:D-isomer specific 2-hydroxyacid dehydrogenase, NAD-binding [candidate division TM7 genomosp. GTL1]|nr:D-isomer specific 2-hydroxyacid dehydrogenase, NAD-binding [candidate division TM7 genomosp. GTL1]